MKLTLELTGALAGKTVRLNKHQFVNGECTLVGGAELEFAVRILERCYGAQIKGQNNGVQHLVRPGTGPGNPEGVPSGKPGPTGEVQEVPDVRSLGANLSDPTDGDAGLGAGGSGLEDAGLHPDKVRKIATAVGALDVKVDAHWTEDGLPAVEVISAAISDQHLTRKMIEVAAPGVTREKVAEAADL